MFGCIFCNEFSVHADYDSAVMLSSDTAEFMRGKNDAIFPVLVLPLTEESVQAMRDRIDLAVGQAGDWSFGRTPTVPEITQSVTTALGLTASRAKRKAGK